MNAKRGWIGLSFLVMATFAIYHRSLNAPFTFDDTAKIVENPDIRSLNGLWAKLMYPYHDSKWERNDPSRPVTYFTFALNYHFGELRPFGYHAVNLLLHALNVILLFLLTRKILKYAYGTESLILPLSVAALFAVHPINSIVVCYTFNRSVELAAFFFLCSFLLFIRSVEGERPLLGLSILCFTLALFSRQDAVTLPALLLAFDFIFLSNFEGSTLRKRYRFHLLYWFVLVGYLAFRYFYFGGIGDLEAGKSANDWPPLLYLGIQPYVLVRYLGLLLVPKGLCFDRVIAKPTTFLQPPYIVSYLLWTGVMAVAWRMRRQKTGTSKVVLFSILWFLIILSPTSSIFPTTAVMAENRVYLAGFGFYLLAALFLALFFGFNFSDGDRMREKRWPPWLMGAFLVVYGSKLSVVTFRRVAVYEKPVLLWEDVLAQYPQSSRAIYNTASEHNALGISYREAGNVNLAIREFESAVSLMPNFAKVHYNLGLTYYYNLKDYAKARQEFLQVVDLDPLHPEVHNNLGLVYFEQKNYDQALKEFQKATEVNPGSSKAHNNLAFLLYKRSDYQSALREFEAGLQLDPSNASVKRMLDLIRSKSSN